MKHAVDENGERAWSMQVGILCGGAAIVLLDLPSGLLEIGAFAAITGLMSIVFLLGRQRLAAVSSREHSRPGVGMSGTK
jgi:hypothetical protein